MYPPAPAPTTPLTSDPSAPIMDPAAQSALIAPQDPYSNDQRLLDIFDKCKREAMDQRWVYEREWLRDLYYTINRQWITYQPARREWVDKRLQRWVPKPVTNKMKEIVQSIRTNLGSISLAIKAQPVGNDTKSIAAADIADQIAPLVHAEHKMDQVMREADFWLIVNGNACLYASWDKDTRFNKTFIQNEQCVTCGAVYPPQQIKESGNVCPDCGGMQFAKATDPLTGQPSGQWAAFGRGKTRALSPFEYAFPPYVTRWDELPYIIMLRWKEKSWYEANMPEVAAKLTYEKSPKDRSLQIFKSLALTNDLGGGGQIASFGASSSDLTEGVTEYEMWMKPTPEFPMGLVLRVVGDKSPVIIRMPEEQVPGPFPYKDIDGNPLFPFFHAQYEHIGGRLWGQSALSPLIQKQDMLNQLDSQILMMVQRMASPIWVVPEDSGIQHFSGEPGFIMKWNALSASGAAAKPDRIEGVPITPGLMQYREMILKDIEELSGAYDIFRGGAPQGIEAFSTMQLMLEQSQGRFRSVFKARGEMYQQWMAFSLELERQFGPDQRVMSLIAPNRGYTFQYFENAQLQGDIEIKIEENSNVPKTPVGKRASLEQANQMGLLDPADPEYRYAMMNDLGLANMAPSLNIHVQSALQVQDEFEKWTENPTGPSPLVMKPWYDAKIHWSERIKWLNGDKMKEILAADPAMEQLIYEHLAELQMIMMSSMPQGEVDPKTGQPKPQGAGMAMKNSQQNSNPKGNVENGPNAGPRM